MRLFVLVMFLLGLIVGTVGCAKPERGLTGAPGVGIVGPQGATGSDGQPARVIPLCPGVTVYPNAFVEVALCINNELFGVYSTNGGFLTKLPPGTYSSNAIGSACTLTIQPNCIVTY